MMRTILFAGILILSSLSSAVCQDFTADSVPPARATTTNTAKERCLEVVACSLASTISMPD
jgi:hypothetical protein